MPLYAEMLESTSKLVVKCMRFLRSTKLDHTSQVGCVFCSLKMSFFVVSSFISVKNGDKL